MTLDFNQELQVPAEIEEIEALDSERRRTEEED
jgi:hypothetical protein